MAKPAIDIHQALMHPAAYSRVAGPVEHRETHISHIYLTQDLVYKIKKPLDLGFLNFTTLEQRRHFCDQELLLNRRLCADTYLEVVPVGIHDNQIRVGSDEEIIDYAVVMRRLPQDRMLDTLLAQNSVELPAAMNRVGKLLADFHARAEVHHSTDIADNAATVDTNWRENFSQTEGFIGPILSRATFDHCRQSIEDFLHRRRELLVQRQRLGFVRDGHGDLHSEHVCLTEPIRIFDCIEFNERFRIADIIADLAFLLMDLEFRGRRDLAQILLASYQKRLDLGPGAQDLLPFYKLYRAYVRGKVDGMLSTEDDVDAATRETAAQTACNYFNLALGYTCGSQPVCLMTCGLMGTGKTTLALALQKAWNCDVWRSDVLRKELAGLATDSKCFVPFGQQLYSPEMTRQTYNRLLEVCLNSLRSGRSVIADASFSSYEEREQFRLAVQELGFPLFIMHLQCPQEETRKRLEERHKQGGDPSDGRVELYQEQLRHFSVPSAEPGLIEVDTSQGLTYNVELVLNAILSSVGAVL